MNRNSKQELIEIIRHETEENANTNERVATILTALNSDKLEVSEVNNPDSFQIGTITATTSKVFLGLYVTGENSATISDVTASKSQADEFPFTPVSVGKLRSLIIHAKIDSQIFYLAEGVEGFTAVDPDYDGLFIKKIIATDSGSYVEEDLKQFQLKANEAWVDLALNDTGATIQTVSVHHAALRFNIISAATNIKVGGFRFYATQFLYDGVQITLRNQTAGDLEVLSISGAGIYPINPDGTPVKLKQFESVTFAYHVLTGLFYALKSGGGASFPELGNDGDVLVKDAAVEGGAKWSNRLTNAESNIVSEIVERAAQDAVLNAKINTEIGNRTTADDYLLSQIVADAVRILALENKGYELTEQIVVNSNMTAQESWKGKVVFVTATCTITIPATLSTNYSFNGITVAGVNLTWAITSPKQWANGTPATTIQNQIFNLIQRGSSNDIYLLGLI